MTRNKKKSPTPQPTEETQMADNDTMAITWTKVKHSSLTENEYGHNHFFNVLGITPLQQLIELRKSLKMPIGDYNDRSYPKDLKIKELPGEIEFKKHVPYITDITFRKYGFQKNGEQITGYMISELMKFIKLFYIEKWDYQNQF